MGSENPSGADNQQERPGFAQWVVGFVDGEGCFSVPIFRNDTCRVGWQVQPSFTVVQGEKSVEVLHLLRRHFGCGQVGRNDRHDNHREAMHRFTVRARGELELRIIPFFEEHPLHGKGRRLREVCKGRTIDAIRSPPHGGRLGADRGDRADHESTPAVAVSGILRGHTPAISIRRSR